MEHMQLYPDSRGPSSSSTEDQRVMQMVDSDVDDDSTPNSQTQGDSFIVTPGTPVSQYGDRASLAAPPSPASLHRHEAVSRTHRFTTQGDYTPGSVGHSSSGYRRLVHESFYDDFGALLKEQW